MSGPRVMVAWRWWYHRCEGMQSGQMTVELAVLVPVVIVVALIVANLMEFVDACAAFDRLSLDEVIADCHKVPGAIWDLGKTLTGHALKSKAG